MDWGRKEGEIYLDMWFESVEMEFGWLEMGFRSMEEWRYLGERVSGW
jgi:hypothetical protein